MNERTIYALGFFDGVHLGHQALLAACRHLAQRTGNAPGVVTFASHPDEVVAGKTVPLINTVAERQQMLLGYGMAQQLVLPFDEKLMSLPWQKFLQMLVEKGAAGFVCGDDFRFGFRGEGDAHSLEEFCRERDLAWAVVPAQTLNGTRISSTHIRTLLTEGKTEEAVQFLGHPHRITGVVMSGRHIGRSIGIPTANIPLSGQVLCPCHGVYACKAIVDCREYLAVTNIGSRPTVGGHQVRAESWLLDFEGDLYGKSLTLDLYSFLRPEQKFPTLEDLQVEIRKNAAETRKILGKI